MYLWITSDDTLRVINVDIFFFSISNLGLIYHTIKAAYTIEWTVCYDSYQIGVKEILV